MTIPVLQTIKIAMVTAQDLPILQAHLSRHFSESGRDGFHFFPFAPNDPNGPRGINVEKSQLSLEEPQWERWFMAYDSVAGKACGHVDLKGYSLRTSAHRCVLGIGIEEPYRALGLGKRLMETAIDFVREIDSIDWLDLMVFAHNRPARKLYAALGFEEISYTKDLFRIGTDSIDDLTMTLNVSRKSESAS